MYIECIKSHDDDSLNIHKSAKEFIDAPMSIEFQKRGFRPVLCSTMYGDEINLRFREKDFKENYVNIFFIDGYVYYFKRNIANPIYENIMKNAESLKDSPGRTFIGDTFITFNQRLDRFTPYTYDDIFNKIAEIKEITGCKSAIVEYEENILK